MGRPKGSIKNNGKCNKCSVDLVVGENAYKGQTNKYKCKSCAIIYSKQWQSNNPDSFKKHMLKQRFKEGTGVYQVMLGEICLYVGEGQLKPRKDKHLKYNNAIASNVVEYCNKHDINRELLSFNVLEYENDEPRRKELEDWYISFLTPVINPTPPLKLFGLV